MELIRRLVCFGLDSLVTAIAFRWAGSACAIDGAMAMSTTVHANWLAADGFFIFLPVESKGGAGRAFEGS